jgi:hypothetical protein
MLIFKEVLSKVEGQSLRIFEWGSGSSTVYYPKFLTSIGRQFQWYAQDNSTEWFQRSRGRVADASLSEWVHVDCSEFPAFWDLPSYSPGDPVPPKTYSDSAMVQEYVDSPKNLGGHFDVMIIDGRFRRRCLQVGAEVIAPKGIVILHDADRDHYHSSLALYPHVLVLETGSLPGTSLRSHIALASFDGRELIDDFANKYIMLTQSRTSVPAFS